MKPAGFAWTSLFLAPFLATTVSAQTFQTIPSWRYLPLQPEFMKSTGDLIAKKDFVSAVDAAQKKRKEKKGTSEEGEARLVLADVCEKLGLLYCTYHLSITTAEDFPGSQPALRGLEQVERLVRKETFSEKRLQTLVNSGSFREIPEQLAPMAAYYVAVDNTKKELFPWVGAAVKKLGDLNFWGLRWKFQSALEEARRKRVEDGIKRLEPLLALSESEPKLAREIRLQLARLKFEFVDYEGSQKLYEELPTEGRQGGRILREKAWVHYWRKNYAEALGLAKTLKSPLYRLAMDPELYLLEMLTLRKICHFAAVKVIAKEFSSKYGNSIENIRKRLPFENDLGLVRLSFIKSNFEPEVETVARIRIERKKLDELKGSLGAEFTKELTVIYDQTEGALREELDVVIKKDLRSQASRLLDIADQIQLVDYLSGLDAYRISSSYEKRDYEAQMAQSGSFTNLFWPVTDEYWRDELPNYRVLVNDQCSEKRK